MVNYTQQEQIHIKMMATAHVTSKTLAIGAARMMKYHMENWQDPNIGKNIGKSLIKGLSL